MSSLRRDTLEKRATTRTMSTRLRALIGEACYVTFEPHAELCHIIPFKTTNEDEVMSAVEYVWNLKLGTLNLNSWRNHIVLRADLHWCMDQKGLILLASQEVIDEFYDAYCVKKVGRKTLNSEYKKNDNVTFLYTLIPTGRMERSSLTRQLEYDTDDEAQVAPFADPNAARAEIEVFWWPYERLGAIQSATAPEFIIWKAGFELRRMQSERSKPGAGHIKDLNRALKHYEEYDNNVLDKVLAIYACWTKTAPLSFTRGKRGTRSAELMVSAGEIDGPTTRPKNK